MNLASFSIRRPIFIISIVILTILTGIVSMFRLGVDMFPGVNIPVVAITIPYPGSGPEEIENLIAKPVEEELSSISGLKRITTRCSEGFAMIIAEFYLETDVRWAEQEVRTKISRARRNLPEEIKEPILLRFDPADQPVLRLALFADLPPGELYNLAKEEIKPSLEQVQNVGAVRILGGRRREIQIELDRNKLNQYSTPALAVARQIMNYGSNVPVGKYESGTQEISYRSVGQFESLSQIEDVVINFSGESENLVNLKEIGTVQDGLEDATSVATLWAPLGEKGKHITRPALFFDIYKQSDANTVSVADASMKKLSMLNEAIAKHKGKPKIIMIRDGSRPIRLNIEDVTESILIGIFLAVVVVYFFLGNIRSTIITGLALPNSMIGAFMLMYFMDFTVNVMTLLALSLSVGLLVDDAIVVRENIYRKMEEGMKPFAAAVDGTKEVMLAVIATTATIIAVFLPIGFLSGMVGQFFKQFGLTVVFAMLVSLFDAIAVAPLLSAYFAGRPHQKENRLVRAFRRFQDWLDARYAVFIKYALEKPLTVILGTILLFVLSIVSTRFVKQTFMPPNDFGEFMVTIQMPPGTSLAGTDAVARQIQSRLEKIPEMDLISTVTGTQEGESNVSTISVRLIPYGKRNRTTSDIKDEARKILKDFKNALPAVMDFSAVGGVQYPFNLYIKGDDLEKSGNYSTELIKRLKKIPDLIEVDADYRSGKPEFQVRMEPQKMQRVGVFPGVAGAELRYHIAGTDVGKLHEGGLEYNIRMRLKGDQRNLQKSYSETKVPNMQYRMIPLNVISTARTAVGPERITRQDRKRVILIHANLAPGGAIGDATDQAKAIIDKELKPPAGVDYKFVGQSEDMKELAANIGLAFGLALLFIYLILSSLYESFITPVTILFAIPPAISGAFFGLLVTFEMMNIFSMIGLIMLMGLVTKNSILLVDYAVQGINDGMSRAEAIMHAGRVRLRPILMTTIAMIAGTLPLAMGLGEVSNMRRSMGIAIIGGLIVSTVITLIFVPAIFSYVDRFRVWVEGKFKPDKV